MGVVKPLALLSSLPFLVPICCTPAPSVPVTSAPSAPALEVPAAQPAAATEAPAPEEAPLPAGEEPAPPSCNPLQFKESEREEPPPALATDAALLRGCQAIAARSRQRIGKLLDGVRDEDEGMARIEPLLRCLDAGRGAWTFEITSATSRVVHGDPASSSDPEVAFRLQARPVFLDEKGARAAVGPTILLRTGNAPFTHFTSLSDLLAFDWDGDGRKELAFREINSQEENNDQVAQANRHWLLTMRRGAILDYTKDTAQISAIRDVDGDQRPDLLMRSPWVIDGPCGIAGIHFPGPRFLRHSLPDGSFSDQDRIAQGFVVNRCTAAPADILEESTDSDPATHIGCALWWGRRPGDILQEIKKKRPADEAPLSSCFPRKELLRIAQIPPPAPFRLSCPPPSP